MGTGVRQKYNVALNSKGYILKGAPGQPLYDKRVIASQVDRLAISDIQYSDFSGANLFYVAQTDWSAGIKDEKRWRDDGKYYYSTNIDAYSKQGSIQLEKHFVQKGSSLAAGVEITTGTLGQVDGNTEEYIGTDDATADSKPRIYEWDPGSEDWASIRTFTNTTTNAIGHLQTYINKLFAFTIGTSTIEVIQSYDGSSWTDHTATVIAASTLTQPLGSRCAAELAGVLYFAIDDFLNDKIAIISYDGSTFTEEVFQNNGGLITSMAAYAGKLYYIIYLATSLELRVFDPATSSDTTIRTFLNVSSNTTGVGAKMLRVFQGKLIITVPPNEIHEYDGSTLVKIFTREDFRKTTNVATEVNISYGCLEKDSKLYWYNLIYDGEVFFNHKLGPGNDDDDLCIPVTVSESGDFYYFDQGNDGDVFVDGGGYKTSTDINYLVMSEMDPISSIDKLLDNITIIFDKLASGTEIEIDYSIDEGTTWVTIGSVNATNDANTTKRTFVPASSVKYNKIAIRAKLNTSNSSNTPVLNDVILAYKPFPDYKMRWSMTVDASQQINLLDGNQEQRTGMEISNELWNLLNLKQKVTLEDTDYFECTLQTALTTAATSARIDTNRPIPRAGRIRAITSGYVEEMFYTSANNDRIWGITRAARGTKARAYAIGTALKNDYDVYVDSVDTRIDVTDENKQENRVQLVLTEG